MKRSGIAPLALFLASGLGLSATPANAAVQTWHASDATVTMSLDPAHLANLGMKLVQARETAEAAPGRELMMEPPLHAFGIAPGFEFEFRTANGVLSDFETERLAIPFRGGLALQTWHPSTKAALTPAFLFDFSIEIDRSIDPTLVRVVSSDPSLVVPLEVRSTSFRFAWNTGELSLRMGDLVITEEWARVLGQPSLAGQYLGTFDLHVRASPESGVAIAPEFAPRDQGPGPIPLLDVTLGELYGLASFGRDGTFPNGRSGLSAATTSCNSGQVRVPWNAPMAETHPFIGLALLRIDANGTLEMIGKNWMKHGFLALSNDQCNLGCEGCGGNELCIGCSDTYSAGLNASRFYLGPREEINPFTGEWEACGSFFDEPTVPDLDCDRDYNGNEPNGVNHRLEVWDEDLGLPGASYYYEGEYVVADDSEPSNTVGWRQCTTSWSGSQWNFTTLGGGLQPNLGPFIFTWGDELAKKEVAADDGDILLAVKVTDLGGGSWHYEYALYNWFSERGIRSFSIPIAGVNVSNVGYHDVDKDAGNDWTVTNDGTTLTWATDDWTTDPDANAVFYQSLYNFRFDADQAPAPGSVNLGIFKPGIGSAVFVDIQTPTSDPTGVVGLGGDHEDFTLMANEPNPFSASTTVRFALAQGRDVRLSVVDVTGRLVQVLAEGPAPAGVTEVRWDGRDTGGIRATSGVYFFRLQSGREVRTVKGTFLR